MFIVSIIGLAVIVGVIYAFIPTAGVLWFGGATLCFWIMDKIREQVEDNFFLNSAIVSITSILSMIPYFFIDDPMLAFWLFMWCSVNLAFQVMTHSQYFTGYVIKRDYDPIWSSTHIKPVKQYFDRVASEGNRAVVIFALIGFLGAMVFLGSLIYGGGLWYTPLPPVFVLLCNIGTLVYMHIEGVTPDTGYGDHDWADNIVKGYLYIFAKIGGVLFAIISAPFMLIREICRMIGAFFEMVREGGSARINKLFWVCEILLVIYCVLGVFGVANFVEEYFESIGVFDADLIYSDFLLTQLVASWDFGKTFFGAIFLFIPYVVAVILSGVLEFLAVIVTAIFQLVYWVFMFLLAFTVEQILPIIITVGAIALLVLYLIDSDKEGYDWFQFIFLTLVSAGLLTLYGLLYSGVISVFA